MKRTLTQILRAVAKSKGLKNLDKWVESILKHAQIDSDYQTYVHLTSHKNMYFGVEDTLFECQHFVLFRQYKNTDFERETDEFEIYTFSDLADKGFIEKVRAAYHDCFDSIVDIRLFLDSELVPFKVLTEDNKPAILGKYNELPEELKIVPEIYQVKLKGDDRTWVYTTSKEKLRDELLKLKDFNNGVDEDNPTAFKTVYKTNNFDVTFSGNSVAIKLCSEIIGIVEGEETPVYSVDILESYILGAESRYYLIGYIDGKDQTYLVPTAENIANFIMSNSTSEVMITDELGVSFVEANCGLLNYCRDREFLLYDLHPAIIPLQTGEKKVGKVKLHTT